MQLNELSNHTTDGEKVYFEIDVNVCVVTNIRKMDNTQRVIFDNNPHVRLRDIFDTAFQHQADDLVPLNDPRKCFPFSDTQYEFPKRINLTKQFKDGDSPEPDTSGYFGPDLEVNRHSRQLGFRDYNHNNSVGICFSFLCFALNLISQLPSLILSSIVNL